MGVVRLATRYIHCWCDTKRNTSIVSLGKFIVKHKVAVQGDQGGILPGQNRPAGPSPGGCAKGRAAAAGSAGLEHPNGHLRLHEPPASATARVRAQKGGGRASWGESFSAWTLKWP